LPLEKQALGSRCLATGLGVMGFGETDRVDDVGRLRDRN
jgi:hypothetical protein